MGIDHTWDGIIAHGVVLRTYYVINCYLTLTDSGVSKEGEARNVPRCIHSRMRGLHVAVYDNCRAVHLDTECL